MYYDSVSKLEIAHSYAKDLGFAVFPCHAMENGVCSCGDATCRNAAKHPLTVGGVKDATKDAETLKRYFSGPYETANIAVATGEPSGIWVLDVDDEDAFYKIREEYGPFPPTASVQTGGGGLHLYFRFDQRCKDFKNAVKFFGGLDVRATGGYVLLPPSLHASGKEYDWIDTPHERPIADAPDWLVDLIPQRTTLTVHESVSVDERVKRYLEHTPPAFTGSATANLPPPRKTQEMSSQVTIPDGHTIIVGGLNLNNNNYDYSGIPLLDKIPIVREVTGLTTKADTCSSMFVFLRPVILRDDKFQDLKFLSEKNLHSADVKQDFPESQSMWIR